MAVFKTQQMMERSRFHSIAHRGIVTHIWKFKEWSSQTSFLVSPVFNACLLFSSLYVPSGKVGIKTIQLNLSEKIRLFYSFSRAVTLHEELGMFFCWHEEIPGRRLIFQFKKSTESITINLPTTPHQVLSNLTLSRLRCELFSFWSALKGSYWSIQI